MTIATTTDLSPALATACQRTLLYARWRTLAHFCLAAHDGYGASWCFDRADYVLALPPPLLRAMVPQLEEVVGAFEAGVDCAGSA